MSQRVLVLFRARLRAQLGAEVVPAAPLLAHGALMAVLCLLVRDALDPFSYALFVLAASSGLIALTLLGDLGSLLRADAASEWAEALPAGLAERRIAQGLVALSLLGALALGALIPAALLAPADASVGMRASLVLAGLEQALAIGALLLAIQILLGERAEGLLVMLQTLLVVGVVAGFLAGLRLVPALRELAAGRASWPSWIVLFPPAWFATATAAPLSALPLPPLWIAHAIAPAAVAVLLAAPTPPTPSGRRTGTLLAFLLSPFRWIAARVWVARSERGVFELVCDALPLERDFVLRTYPMIGIPLAFLLAGAKSEVGPERQGLLALLLFTPAVYLPVLIAQVPATSSPGARWILDGAPIRPSAVRNAAIKALFVRFILPLYLVLAVVAASMGEAAFASRLGAPGALASLFVLRRLYPRIAVDPPLSTAPHEVEVRHDWMGILLSLAVVLVLFALLAQRFIDTAPRAIGLFALLLGLELASDRFERSRES